MIQRIKKYSYFLIMCVVCIVPRIVLATQALPFRTRADELGTLAGAAYIAGLDWSDLLSRASYYGFGATAIFAPLFHIFEDPILIYRIMIGVWGVLQGVVGMVAWHLAKKYFSVTNEKVLVVLSSATSYAVVTRSTAIFNETPLIVVVWLLCWCLLALNKNVENKKKKCICTLIMSLLMMYSLTLHTRAVMFLIVAIIIEVAYLFVRKKSLFSIPVFVVTILAGYVGANTLISYMQDTVWAMQAREYVANTSIGLGGYRLLFHVENWQSWLNIVLGQINTLSMISGTVIVVAIVWLVTNIIKIIKNRFKAPVDIMPYLCIIGFAGLCMIGTIIGQSISEWLEYAVVAMKNGMDSQEYGLKGFTYIRYVGPYIGVLIWGMLIYTINYTSEVLKLKGVAIVVSLFINIYWLACILPYIYHNSVTNEAYLPFAFINNFEYTTRLRTYLVGSGVIVLSLIIFWVLIKHKKWCLMLSLYLVFLLYQFGYNAYFNDTYLMRNSFKEIETTYELLDSLDEKGLISDTIGVFDQKNSSHATTFAYQFCFFDKKIVSLRAGDESTDDEDVIITNTLEKFDEFLLNGYAGACIDNKSESYLVTKNKQVIDELFNQNYEVIGEINYN